MKNQKKLIIILVSIIAVLLIVICCFVFSMLGGTESVQQSSETSSQNSKMAVESAGDWEGSKSTYTGEKNVDTIDIPGFSEMNFKAGARAQSVNLFNPENNTCYFRMSLLLPDRTEIWKSNLVEPGKGLYEITLNRTLEEGVYEGAILKYECFSLSDQSPLNGSEIKIKINVLK